jgi:hypothetical protein
MSTVNIVFPIELPRHRRRSPRIHTKIDQARLKCHCPRPTGGIHENVIRLTQLIETFRSNNTRLQSLLEHLTHDSNDLAPLPIPLLSESLENYRQRLALRQSTLVDLERKLTLFRAEDPSVTPPPNGHALRTPPRRKFVMSPPEPNEQKAYVNGQHAQLTERALANERLILLTRMKLRLAHDYRGLEALQRRLARITVDEDEQGELEVQRLKKRCRAVKATIEREKERIRQEKWIGADEYFAAVAIQSAWRGFLFRKNGIIGEMEGKADVAKEV